MATIPTGKLERELRRLYMRWVHQLPKHEHFLQLYIDKFHRDSTDLIERMGGDIARLGALPGFPAPKRLNLDLHVGTIYSDMELAAIRAQIRLGLNPRDSARELVRAEVDKSYRRLERLARTETVRAYWKNAWDSIDGLDMVMIWSAEDGPRTCAWCKERDGMVIEGSEVRDHPNGRCTPIPTPISQVDYKGSVLWDGTIYQDKNWATYHTPAAAPAPAHNSFSDEALGMSFSESEAKGMSLSFADLTPEQQRAVGHYQGAGYTEINGALRSGYPPHLTNYADLIKHLDSVMLPLDRDITLHRGQGYRTMLRDLGINFHPDDPPYMWDLKGKIGTQLRQPGYYSTSISQEVAGEFLGDHSWGFLIDVEVPKGVGVHYVQTGALFNDIEEEMLLQRGLDFVLTDAELVTHPLAPDQSIWRITLRAVLP